MAKSAKATRAPLIGKPHAALQIVAGIVENPKIIFIAVSGIIVVFRGLIDVIWVGPMVQ
jgi:hypothetical protein